MQQRHILRESITIFVVAIFLSSLHILASNETTVKGSTPGKLEINEGRIVYSRLSTYTAFDSELVMYNFKTKKEEVMSSTIPAIRDAVKSPMTADFSPDGKLLTFTAIPKVRPLGYYNLDVYVYNFETKQLTDLTPNQFIPDEDPKFSPDGKYIAFKQSGDIKVMDLTGKLIYSITNDKYVTEESMPVFTHDMQEIVYSEGVGFDSSLRRYNLATKENKVLVDREGYQDYYPIAISDDIWYTSMDDGHEGDQQYVYDMQTGKVTYLKINEPLCNNSDVAPVLGNIVVFSTNRWIGGYDLAFGDVSTGVVDLKQELNMDTTKAELAPTYTHTDAP